MAFKDDSRFYEVDGIEYPSVTTCMSILDKSGPLMGWAVNEERKAIRTVFLDFLVKNKDYHISPADIWREIIDLTKGVKASEKVKNKALDIGTQIHDWIAWRTQMSMGQNGNSAIYEPKLSEEARIGCDAWVKWASDVDFQPIFIEKMVLSKKYGYAGRFDAIAKINGKLSILDYKSSKAIYPEYGLQLVAYEYAAREIGIIRNIENIPKCIVRLPKTPDNLEVEMEYMDNATIDDFVSVRASWVWKRKAEGKNFGGPVDKKKVKKQPSKRSSN